MKRDLITIDDLSNDEIESIFALADQFLLELAVPTKNPEELPYRIQGRMSLASDWIISTLFYEPSTRTKFSFESAMTRLGGHVLSSADPTTTSAAKGESLADTVRVIQNYADLIVIRHPREGAARVAADYTDIPVINAGDGSHEHPTQTLCDLYTLRREKQSLKDIHVLLCGDLKNGRTIHSLVFALARFGAHIILLPAEGMELPPHVRKRLETDYGCSIHNIDDHPIDTDVDVVYITPEESHQLSLIHDLEEELVRKQVSEKLARKALSKIDVCYVTRLQVERLEPNGVKKKYPVIDSRFLRERRYKKTHVLHPLPRVDELSYDLDKDPRGAYFKQAAYGVPIRMALIASLLKLKQILPQARTRRYQEYSRNKGITCSNPQCITHSESERRYLLSKFWIINNSPLTVRCMYCEYEIYPRIVGNMSSKKYFPTPSLVEAVEDMIFFSDEHQAQQAEFHPSSLKHNKAASNNA